ncbi:YdcF family protein [Nocardia otitidiscaviarum]|uniref:YdcF family protein n=2 Tax=Nocardia otitidiscaviarum TaxID=1823 RepID=A0A516NXJ0_9NOCA|nr:YdcF family protein [Nocardia otitidiscaviarum]QDP83615.1 YdcF family protein [Nocardia otitidiscaviarum]
MRPELIDRLRAGYLGALVSPTAPVIVTGGNPRSGVTEAEAMAAWLVAHGIPAARIHVEPAARSTVENAAYTAEMMTRVGSSDALLITSADHMPRATAIFRAAGIDLADTFTPDQLPVLLHYGPLP